jgi:hypothetical protein
MPVLVGFLSPKLEESNPSSLKQPGNGLMIGQLVINELERERSLFNLSFFLIYLKETRIQKFEICEVTSRIQAVNLRYLLFHHTSKSHVTQHHT